MPPKKSPSLYSIKKTTIWFAIASVLLLLCLVAMVFQDSIRDWKVWQRKFMAYTKQRTEAELETAKKSIDQTKLEELKATIENGKADLKARKGEIKELKKEINQLSVKHTVANSRYQDLKQFQDSDRYFYEEHVRHHETEKAAKYKKQLSERSEEIHQAKLDLESADAALKAKQAELAAIEGGVVEAEKEVDAMHRDVERLETKVKKMTESWDKAILNAPMLDFMNPTLRIQQTVVENLHEDFYYVKAQRVDRCTTCHVSIDQRGYEDAPQPFTTHPNLDLYLSSDAPHSLEKFGCTTCHGGSGHSVNFTTAAHTPSDEAQAKEWKEKYGWHDMKHWPDKMYPKKHIEASCAQCHTGVVEVPQAPVLNEGRRLATTYGCFNCHKVEGFEDRWKVGPSLTHVQSKLEEDWIARWLHNPKEFRASTKMPQVFHLSNTADPESAAKDDASIAGIAAYLMKNSDPLPLESTSLKGDIERGQKLVEEVGCLGCHSVAGQDFNNHGPELSGLGSKVKPDWLFDWLKDPKRYHAESRMPDLRLSDQEAADIVAYLLQDKNEKFESIRLPRVNPEVVNELAISFLTGNMRYEDAQKEIEQMSDNARLEYVGKKMIARQGCFGCHDIKGFEDHTPIGAELTHVGSKEVGKFDFGFIHIEHSRQGWFFQKMKEPRIFDKGKVKAYKDKLRMPHFGFTDGQADALTTYLLSLQKADIPLEMQDVLSEDDKQTEKGRLLAQKLNCQGCHTLDGKEGAVRAYMDDLGLAPPILDGEGAKVQEPWLYHFLDEPTIIRPWLQYRMPTFGLEDHELTTFVQYFNHLSHVEQSFTANEYPKSSKEVIDAGRGLFKTFQCIKCHQAEPPKGLSASFLAPNLVMSKDRLRPEWVIEWMVDPQTLQEGTMMPTFFYDGQSPVEDVLDGDANKQIAAMRDYLAVFTPEEARKITQPAAPQETTA